ncbi:MAG TPA: tRNA (cytidine(56)-2'-O)-methyltransferase [archaeon]|nr:tRNA (cytidine(56)-2'-O)-methyltransferase [archaeon]
MIVILRLGHRLGRDQRISTHCGLVSRVLGADKIIYSGEQDSGIIKNIEEVGARWGGSFTAEYQKNWKNVVEEYKRKKFSVVHLTMYGQPVHDKIKALRKKTNILVVVGGEKVPPDIYQIADYNIAIGNQPHSEIAALAIFLHEYFAGKELEKNFKNAKLKIIPQEKGKKVDEAD